MNEKRPDNIQEARKIARRRRRRRLMILRTSIVLAVVLLLVLVGALVVMKIIGTQQSKRGETTSFLAVKEIRVEGDTRYTVEELIERSGLYVGQSLLGVNKVQAHDALLAAFPYLSTVEIGNASFDVLRIRVTETKVLGAVEMADGWMIVGENNHALELLPADQPVPEGTLRIRGASLEGERIGAALLDERSLRICRTLAAAANLYGLDSMTTIDITEKTNISLLLNERMQVILGNETNMPAQIETLVDTLPTLLKNNGQDAAGRLDMTSYADDDPNNNRSVYTPQELLDSLKQPEGDDSTPEGDTSSDGDTTTGNTTE